MNTRLQLRRNWWLAFLLMTFVMVENVGFNAISFHKPPSRSSLIAYWAGNKNTKDAAGGHNGISVKKIAYSPGVRGQAFKFSGNGAYVKIPKSSNLNIGNQITIEFWMKIGPNNPLDNYQGLVASDFYGLEMAGSGVQAYVTSDSGATWAITGAADVSDGQWHHMVSTYDGTQLQLYMDGEPFGAPVIYSGNISVMSPNDFLAIGSEDGRIAFPECIGTRYFNGLIDEVRIYNRALSAQEVEIHFLAGQ